jgi:hypothetical protein
METNLGTSLTRDQMKKIVGGQLPPGGSCGITVNCYRSIFNPETHKWDSTNVGSVTCSGSSGCGGTATGVSCPQADGSTDTSTCPIGSAPL